MSAPAYNETVTILANIVDPVSGVKNATLRYEIGEDQHDIIMTQDNGLYEAIIPALPYDTEVTYLIYSFDNAGNSAMSSNFAYAVEDPYQPVMGVPTWTPQDPIVNENVTVSVTVTEPLGASGVDQVILLYSNATSVFTIVMTDNQNGNWTAVVGNQTGAKVAFIIKAIDKAGNEIETVMHEFSLNTPAFPLAWILAAIALLSAATGGGTLYVRRKKRRSTTASSMPPTGVKPPS
jgi:hypothetical protein